MPELPEVETIRRQLAKEIVGARVRGVTVRFAKRLNMPAKRFAATLAGSRVTDVGRRAKLVLVSFDNGWVLAVHLKMTGRLLIKPAAATPAKHDHVVFRFADGRQLFFEDVRKFGYLKLVRAERLAEELLSKDAYGPEPLEPGFTFDRFASCVLARPKTRIKPTLMDQRCIAGIGNIYADETLWRAKVRPDRRVASLTRPELRAIYRGARTALSTSIENRGTSSDDFLDVYGEKGENAAKLKAYGRQGRPCARCGRPLLKTRLGGRGTHYCGKCQV